MASGEDVREEGPAWGPPMVLSSLLGRGLDGSEDGGPQERGRLRPPHSFKMWDPNPIWPHRTLQAPPPAPCRL